MELEIAKNMLFLIPRLGIKWFLFRSGYELRRRMGLLKRRFPERPWSTLSLSSWVKEEVPTTPGEYLAYRRQEGLVEFFFQPKMQRVYAESILTLQGTAHHKLLIEVDKVTDGVLKFFEHREGKIGFPPQWHLNPFSGRKVDANCHWVDTSDFGDVGDIKVIWEPSRFAIAYKLVRAYWITGNEKYPDTFWQLVENWRLMNLPQRGPNWKCGQEAAFRLMAFCFALYGFARSPHSTAERVAMLIAMIATHAERIERNIGYALSQKNDHGISESLGLYTVGCLFPEFRRAEYWRLLGKRLIIREGMRQIYSDGAYVEHSTSYHRLMFHDFLWTIRLGQVNNDTFPESLLNRLRLSLNFLYQLVDAESGRVPNYGPNDGALILPLNICDYLDYRPTLQAMSVLLNSERLFAHGPWDEDLLWLFGPQAFQTPLKHKPLRSSAFKDGGYYTFRGKKSWGMIRCHTYRDRPSQADMLHLDLWYEGQNILRDTGTFQYNCPPPWNHYFKSTAAHNTVEVDDQDQMEKGPRFLWFRWTKSKVRHNEKLSQLDGNYWEGEHYGYQHGKNPIVHRRAVVRLGDRWVIIDDILGDGKHAVTLRWHLANVSWEISKPGTFVSKDLCIVISVQLLSNADAVIELLHGQETPQPEGWESLYYGERQPIPVIKCHVMSPVLPLRFVTILHFESTIKWQTIQGQIFEGDKGRLCHLNPPIINSERLVIFTTGE